MEISEPGVAERSHRRQHGRDDGDQHERRKRAHHERERHPDRQRAGRCLGVSTPSLADVEDELFERLGRSACRGVRPSPACRPPHSRSGRGCRGVRRAHRPAARLGRPDAAPRRTRAGPVPVRDGSGRRSPGVGSSRSGSRGRASRSRRGAPRRLLAVSTVPPGARGSRTDRARSGVRVAAPWARAISIGSTDRRGRVPTRLSGPDDGQRGQQRDPHHRPPGADVATMRRIHQPPDAFSARPRPTTVAPAGSATTRRTSASVTSRSTSTASGTIVSTRADILACALCAVRSRSSDTPLTHHDGKPLERRRHRPAEVCGGADHRCECGERRVVPGARLR